MEKLEKIKSEDNVEIKKLLPVKVINLVIDLIYDYVL